MFVTRRAGPALLAAFFLACSEPTNFEDGNGRPDAGAIAPVLGVLATVPPVCGDITVTRLIADKTAAVGSVEVTQDGTVLYIVYNTDSGSPIHRTALFVGPSADDIPTNRAGNPRIGAFPHRGSHAGTNKVPWAIPLATLGSSDIVVAAFAEVGEEREGAWGEGEAIGPEGNWSMYFGHTVPGCVVVTIGAAGGEVSTADGRAALVIGPGALAEPVDVTIEPVSVDDLFDQIPPEEVDPELGTVFGVWPIEGAVWDLGPDGLEFLTPATIVLRYDEDDLPEDGAEEDLGVFAFDGTFERLSSIVDTEANTITASIEHFTFAFAGLAGGQLLDLDVTSLSRDPEAPAVGEVVQVTAEVRNNGPGTAVGAAVRYEVQGSVFLGDMGESCTALADPGVADVAVSCGLPPLGVGDSGSTTFQIIPQSVGTVTLRATASVSVGDTDADMDNDSRQLEFDVDGVPGVNVDLAPSPIRFTGSLAPGEAAAFQSFVRNWGPGASDGGTLTYRAVGDVLLGGGFSTYSEVDTGVPAMVAVECPIVPLEPFVTTGDIPPFEIVPQSTGIVTVTSTVSLGSGYFDSNPENDQWRNDFAVGVQGADLEMTGIVAVKNQVGGGGFRPLLDASEIRVGSVLNFLAAVQNRGSGNSGQRKVTYHAQGDVLVGPYPLGNCTEIPSIHDVSVSCDVAGFVPGSAPNFPALRVIAQSVGPILVEATLEPDLQDWNPANDGTQGTAFGVIEGEVDLRPQLFSFGGSLLATVQNLGPDPIVGGTLTLEVFGDFAVGDLPAGCTEVADPMGDSDLEVECDLGQTASFGPIAVSPLTQDAVEIWATTRPAEGQREINPADDIATIFISGS